MVDKDDQDTMAKMSLEEVNQLVHACASALAAASKRTENAIMIGIGDSPTSEANYVVLAISLKTFEPSMVVLGRAIHELYNRVNAETMQFTRKNLVDHLKSSKETH